MTAPAPAGTSGNPQDAAERAQQWERGLLAAVTAAVAALLRSGGVGMFEAGTRLRRDLRAITIPAARATLAAARTSIATDATTARAQAAADLRRLGIPVSPTLASGASAADQAALDALGSAANQVEQRANQVFRQVAATIAVQSGQPPAVREFGAQKALDGLTRHGLAGAVDRRGRAWSLPAYTAMVTRTLAHRAAVDTYTSALTASGMDLVMVTTSVTPCRECAEWEGRVLSISGYTLDYPSIADARDGGLWHPNCRHGLTAWADGVTLPEPAPPLVQSADLAAAMQALRQAQRAKATALTPQASADANRKIVAAEQAARTARTDIDRRYSEPGHTPISQIPTPPPPPAAGSGGNGGGGGSILARDTLDAIAAARAMLPADRAGWDGLVSVTVPAESKTDREIREYSRLLATYTRALEQMHGQPGFAPLAHVPVADLDAHLDAARAAVDAAMDKLDVATTAADITTYAQQMEDAENFVTALEGYKRTRETAQALTDRIEGVRANPDPKSSTEMVGPQQYPDYDVDAHREKLPPEQLLNHLGSVLDVGALIRRDIEAAMATDPGVVDAMALLGSDNPYAVAAGEKRLATAQSRLSRRALSEARDLGGHQQRVELVATSTSPTTGPGTDQDLADLRAVEAFYPTDWLRAADARGVLHMSRDDERAGYYTGHGKPDELASAGYKVGVDEERTGMADQAQEAMLHELAHRMEDAVPGLTHLEFALVRARATHDGLLEPVIELFPGQSGPAEWALRDDWTRAYTGKVYKHGAAARDPAHDGHELFSCAMQDVFGRSHLRYGGDLDGPDPNVLEHFAFGVLSLL